jgi:hypothetical protein
MLITMKNVSEITVAELREWMLTKGTVFFSTNARLYATALARFEGQIQEDEPRTIEWFGKNLEVLATRLGRDQESKVQTSSLKTYLSRARAAVQYYGDFHADPVGWDPSKTRTVRNKVERPSGNSPAVRPGSSSVSDCPIDLQGEINECLREMTRWPRLQSYLLQAILTARSAGPE